MDVVNVDMGVWFNVDVVKFFEVEFFGENVDWDCLFVVFDDEVDFGFVVGVVFGIEGDEVVDFRKGGDGFVVDGVDDIVWFYVSEKGGVGDYFVIGKFDVIEDDVDLVGLFFFGDLLVYLLEYGCE